MSTADARPRPWMGGDVTVPIVPKPVFPARAFLPPLPNARIGHPRSTNALWARRRGSPESADLHLPTMRTKGDGDTQRRRDQRRRRDDWELFAGAGPLHAVCHWTCPCPWAARPPPSWSEAPVHPPLFNSGAPALFPPPSRPPHPPPPRHPVLFSPGPQGRPPPPPLTGRNYVGQTAGPRGGGRPPPFGPPARNQDDYERSRRSLPLPDEHYRPPPPPSLSPRRQDYRHQPPAGPPRYNEGYGRVPWQGPPVRDDGYRHPPPAGRLPHPPPPPPYEDLEWGGSRRHPPADRREPPYRYRSPRRGPYGRGPDPGPTE